MAFCNRCNRLSSFSASVCVTSPGAQARHYYALIPHRFSVSGDGCEKAGFGRPRPFLSRSDAFRPRLVLSALGLNAC
jgi:hypothetical protein